MGYDENTPGELGSCCGDRERDELHPVGRRRQKGVQASPKCPGQPGPSQRQFELLRRKRWRKRPGHSVDVAITAPVVAFRSRGSGRIARQTLLQYRERRKVKRSLELVRPEFAKFPNCFAVSFVSRLMSTSQLSWSNLKFRP